MEIKLIQNFKGVHASDTAIICARGPSMMEQIKNPLIENFITIGLNQIESEGFTPTYLLTANTYKKKEDLPFEKCIKQNSSKFLFSYHDLQVSNQVLYDVERIKTDGPNIQHILDRNNLFICKTSTFPAIALALYMGFSTIGILGFDLINHVSSKLTEVINTTCDIISNYCAELDMDIYNLSSVSRVESFKKMKLDIFIEEYSP